MYEVAGTTAGNKEILPACLIAVASKDKDSTVGPDTVTDPSVLIGSEYKSSFARIIYFEFDIDHHTFEADINIRTPLGSGMGLDTIPMPIMSNVVFDVFPEFGFTHLSIPYIEGRRGS